MISLYGKDCLRHSAWHLLCSSEVRKSYRFETPWGWIKWWQNFIFFPPFDRGAAFCADFNWQHISQKYYKCITFSFWTRMAYCRVKGLSALDFKAFSLHCICLCNSFKQLISCTNRVNKTFFSPCSLSSCFLIHTSLHSAQPQGSSSLYNALRKEGIIMNRRNCVVRKEKVMCVSYLGSLKCRTTNSQVYRIYSL